MKNYVPFVLLFTILFSFGCLKKDLSKPPVPYLEAHVNNKVWVADTITSSFSGGIFDITAKTKKGKRLNIRLTGLNISTYTINKSTEHAHTADFYTSPDMTNSYNSIAHKNSSGYVRITSIDEEKGLVSGEFFMILFQDVTFYKVEIAQGKFSNLNYLNEELTETAL